ncbi:MAG: RNase adapter RapZ [Alphaproteobacteria bacterium]|nr:RNase adapter RapZ [Alphaproteobacteria bacterium]
MSKATLPLLSLLIVTGQSGAGLSSTLKCLEDIGYEALDNFPLDLFPALFEENRETRNPKPIALGVDTRTRQFSTEQLKKSLAAIEDRSAYKIVFISCQEEKLQQRFSETRRPHPLAKERTVIEGIHAEHDILAPIQDMADIVIDTTDLSIHDLRRTITGMFADDKEKKLTINLLSFSYKKGLPRAADIVFDVRFLKNPHWDETLRDLTGKNEDVGKYIQQDENFSAFLKQLKNMLKLLLPAYEKEGKHYLTIAFGCTGGKHRSVFLARTLNQWLISEDHCSQVQHLEID